MLCQTCSNIDLKRLLTTPVPDEKALLGTWQNIHQREQTCDFCGVLATAVRHGPLNARNKLTDDIKLILKPNVTIMHHPKTDADVSKTFRLQILSEDYDDVGDVLLLDEDAHLIDQSAMGHGRLHSSTTINFALVRQWISECEQSHEKCKEVARFDRFGIKLPRETMLIDVHSECLVDSLPNYQYTALSYTWGNAIQYKTKDNMVNDLKLVGALSTKPLTKTIRDAMTLTRNLGLRYLWTDALCIIQDNDKHKLNQMNQMHHIYAGATITIVAATGTDANSGLERVNIGGSNLDQHMVTIQGFRLVARLSFLNRTVQQSNYNTRAWTYQESCISRRLLYVTFAGTAMSCCQGITSEEMVLETDGCKEDTCRDHSVYLDSTQRNLWREFITRKQKILGPLVCNCGENIRELFQKGISYTDHPQSHLKGTYVNPKFLKCEDCQEFRQTNDLEWLMYKELVRGYTYRSIKESADRLRAFAGIAGLLEGHFDTKFLHGLPEKYLDFALTWIPHHNLTAPCRRDGLDDVPSWSWGSHDIRAEYTGDTWLTSEVDWHRVDENKNLSRVRSFKTFGTHAPLRKDFDKPVTMDQLRSNKITLNQNNSEAALYGWCQVSSRFFLKDTQLYDENKNLVKSPVGYVRFSDMPPKTNQNYVPVEVLFLSRSYSDYLRFNTGPGEWETSPHLINLLVISRRGNVATRLAKAETNDTLLWKQVQKEWMLIKLI
jgi:Heterokaryon incompatibility protein (HET)